MKKIFIKNIILVLIFSLISCASAQNRDIRIDKVKIVNNKEKGIWETKHEKRIKLKKDLEIGVLEGEENKMFYRISDIKVDSEGNIYVLERGNKRVQKFDKNSNFLLTIGNEGEGPGEFKNPIALFVTKDHYIYVLDNRNMRVSQFNQSGEFIDSFRPKQRPIDFVIDSNHNVIILENGHADFKLIKYNMKGDIILSFGDIFQGKNIFETAIYNKGCVTIDKNDNIYMSYLQPYRIDKYDSKGNLLAKYSRKLPYKIVKPQTNIEDQSNNIRAVKFNFYTRLSADIVVDEEKIYNLITDGRSLFTIGQYLDLFDSNGTYLYKIDLENPARKFCIDNFGNFYFAVEISQIIKSQNSDDSILVPRIEKYTIK